MLRTRLKIKEVTKSIVTFVLMSFICNIFLYIIFIYNARCLNATHREKANFHHKSFNCSFLVAKRVSRICNVRIKYTQHSLGTYVFASLSKCMFLFTLSFTQCLLSIRFYCIFNYFYFCFCFNLNFFVYFQASRCESVLLDLYKQLVTNIQRQRLGIWICFTAAVS